MNSNIAKIHSFLQSGAKVSVDTRKVTEGCVFFALKGENFDANNFVGQAIDAGAIAAVVDNPDLEHNEKFIRVDNVLETLQKVAQYHRSLFNIPVIGITGSNGKTTTKELLNCVLSQKFNTLCTRGNFNNHIGVPLTLLELSKDHEIAIIEMGANHVREIAFLSNLSNPTAGLITNIGKAHIEGFGSFENVIIAKTELYTHLKNGKGTIFLNADNEILSKHVESDQCITYGSQPASICNGKIISANPFLVVECELAAEQGTANKTISVHSQLLGKYNFENIMAAVAVGYYFGVENLLIKHAIESYTPSNNRSQLKESNRNTLVLDAYNANPTSMKAAIDNFMFLDTPKPKALILGDMLELGDSSKHEHDQIVNQIQNLNLSFIILVGKNFCDLHVDNEKILTFENTQQASQWLLENTPTDCLILIKGSRGIQLEKLESYL
jgi:UDP-N-acetylmuramoyl-tripeptide--D-alanyl-D-alanine ligase